MNCKPGDLARIVSSTCGNEGKIVRCVALYGMVSWLQPNGDLVKDWGWEITPAMPTFLGSMSNLFRDARLKPIRDGEGNESWFKAAPITEPSKQGEHA